MIFLRSKRLEKKTSDAREPSLYRSICTSIISTLLSLVMLVGTTFAWFTDSITSGVYKIQAGNLATATSYCTELPASGEPVWFPLNEGNMSMFGGMTFTSGASQTAYLKLVNSSSGDVVYKFRFESDSETEGKFTGDTENRSLRNMLNFSCALVDEGENWMTELKGAMAATTSQKLDAFAATSPGPFEVTVAQGQIVYVALTIAMDEYDDTLTWEIQPSIQLRLQIDISNYSETGESQTSRQLMAAPPIVMGVYNIANDSGVVTVMQTKPPVTEEAESNDTNVTGSDEVVANPNITETPET